MNLQFLQLSITFFSLLFFTFKSIYTENPGRPLAYPSPHQGKRKLKGESDEESRVTGKLQNSMSARATTMAWRTPFPPSKTPTSFEFSIMLFVCLRLFFYPRIQNHGYNLCKFNAKWLKSSRNTRN